MSNDTLTPTANGTNAAPGNATAVTDASIFLKVVDNSGTPKWQYSSTLNGTYTDVSDDGINDTVAGAVTARVTNATGQDNLSVDIGESGGSVTLDNSGFQNYQLSIPGTSGNTNDYNMTATYPSGDSHDPTFYVKRSGG